MPVRIIDRHHINCASILRRLRLRRPPEAGFGGGHQHFRTARERQLILFRCRRRGNCPVTITPRVNECTVHTLGRHYAVQVDPEVVALVLATCLRQRGDLSPFLRKRTDEPQLANRLAQIFLHLCVVVAAPSDRIVVESYDVHVLVARIVGKVGVFRVAFTTKVVPHTIWRIGEEYLLVTAGLAQIVGCHPAERAELLRRAPGASPPEPRALHLMPVAHYDRNFLACLLVNKSIEEIGNVLERSHVPGARIRKRRSVVLPLDAVHAARSARSVKNLPDYVAVGTA